jgi:DNA-binding SARP family transcriptional activator
VRSYQGRAARAAVGPVGREGHAVEISFSILGPMTAELRPAELSVPPAELDAGPFKQRLLLALLLCRCNSVVLVEELIDTLWWDGPPRTAHKNIQVYISHLRKLVAADGRSRRLGYRPPGYQLVLVPAELDALRFEDLARSGRLALRRGDARAAAASMREALGLWRGPALADLQVSPALRDEAARLDDRRLAVYEDWFEAELLLGNHAEVLEQLEGVMRAHPLRERLRSHQLIALYRGGRQAEALAEYDNHRQLLAAELGLDPSPALRRLYQDILSGNPGLSAPAPATFLSAAPVSAALVVAGPGPARPASAAPSAVLSRPAALPWRLPWPAAPQLMPPPAFMEPMLGLQLPELDAEVVAHIAGAPPVRAGPGAAPPRPAGARATEPRPSGLPRALDDFTGRQDELGDLLSYFGDGTAGSSHLRRSAVVVGPPGAGTSTLALQAARVLAPRFRDGLILLPARGEQGTPRPAGALLDDLLGRLQPCAQRSPVAIQDRSTLLRSRLADLQLLLILDGVADEAQVRPLLPGAGGCSVILTSCRRLGGLDGLRRFQLGTFTEDEALDLLGRLIGPERVAQDRSAARRIVAACGLLPLAVRIAGARLAGLEHLPLDRFAGRLEDPARLLDELAIGDLSVRDRFDRYLRGLDAAERLALMQVAAAWGPSSGGSSALEQLLERLAGVHALTITDRGRCSVSPLPFAMPAPLWVYAQRLLIGSAGDARP